jgi:hypothetical protein
MKYFKMRLILSILSFALLLSSCDSEEQKVNTGINQTIESKDSISKKVVAVPLDSMNLKVGFKIKMPSNNSWEILRDTIEEAEVVLNQKYKLSFLNTEIHSYAFLSGSDSIFANLNYKKYEMRKMMDWVVTNPSNLIMVII